ncbi:MAG TPA: cysteine synthase family protein [Candidatus Bathyarchaeia archaeon]|nr:cysteine synthase family protein [Candidatus Bathyarchaeia archaeon]
METQSQQRVRVASNADVLASIGNTPLFRLRKMARSDMAEIWAKWEGSNPTGSMKDRMALSMVEGGEKRGQLKPGGSVVEYTGGSTGSSLAMVCAAKGYRSHFVSSDAFADEKLATMRILGGKVEIIPSKDRKITPELIQTMIARAKELSKEPNTFWTDQFNNPDNKAGYHKMGQEILDSIGGFDAFVMSAGTGGCFSGNAEVFKERLARVKCVAVEPASSRHLSGGTLGGHRIEGIGPGFIPKIMRMDLVDEIISVSDEDAYKTARELAKSEGVFGGISSGANTFAALNVARKLGPGHKVVTVIVDSGLRYLAGDLFR